VDPAYHCPCPGVVPASAHPVELVLGHREHDPQYQATRVGSEIEAILDAGEGARGGADAVDELQSVHQRSSEAVELGHHDPVPLAALDPLDGLLQLRAIQPRSGGVELLEDLAALVPERLDPCLDSLTLLGRTDELGPVLPRTWLTRM
jgi:hypothetical protein